MRLFGRKRNNQAGEALEAAKKSREQAVGRRAAVDELAESLRDIGTRNNFVARLNMHVAREKP